MQEAMDEVKMVVEGVYSARAAKSLAEKYQVEMPIIEEVNKVLFEDKPAADAVRDLMLRDKKVEFWLRGKRKPSELYMKKRSACPQLTYQLWAGVSVKPECS